MRPSNLSPLPISAIKALNVSYITLSLIALSGKDWLGELLASFLPLVGLGGLIWSIILTWLLLNGKMTSTLEKLIAFTVLMLSLISFSAGVQYFDYSSTASPPGLRVASLNKLVVNRDYEEIRSVVKAIEPDVLGMVEVSPKDADALGEGWKHQIVTNCQCDGGRNSELMLLSRYPLEDKGAESLGTGNGGILRADMDYIGTKLRVLVAHPKAPIRTQDLPGRNQLLIKLADEINNSPHPVIVMGDFNVTPWSREFKSFQNSTADQVINVKGDGFYTTWCLDNKRSLACAPVDFIFAPIGSSAGPLNTRDINGSDHDIIWTDIILDAVARDTIRL